MSRFFQACWGYWLSAALLGGFAGGLRAETAAAEPSRTPMGGGASIDVQTLAAVLVERTLTDGTVVKEWQPATEISEGEVVFYTVRITNPGPRAAHNVVVTRPVPANTRYVANSAAAPGAILTFSLDGGVSFAPPHELRVKDPRGVLRPAPPEQYTHLRWQLRYPLAPGATAFARFQAEFR